MSELLPCPFCGETASVIETYDDAIKRYAYQVMCLMPLCNAQTGVWTDKDAAVEAWNTRSERTCENITIGMGHSEIFLCSECGYGFTDIYLPKEGEYPFVPNYCPNCGSKVV